jgi:hypothetical protein
MELLSLHLESFRADPKSRPHLLADHLAGGAVDTVKELTDILFLHLKSETIR